MSGRLSEGTGARAASASPVELTPGHPEGASATEESAPSALRATTLATTALVAVALALLVSVPSATIAWRRGFDGLYGQDAYAYYDYAVHSVRNSMLSAASLEPFFWPPGYPILVALVSLATTQPLAGQLVSLVMGALVPVLTFAAARELQPRDWRLPLIAGVLAAAPGQLWQSSIVVMADTTGLALATFAAFALLRYGRTHALAWLLGASAAIAYATLSRWIYGLVGIPFTAYALMLKPRWMQALAAVTLGALVLLPVVGGSAVAALLQPDTPAAFAGNLQVYSWSPLNAFKRDFFTADGHLVYSLPNSVYYAIAPANLAFWTPLLAPWVLVGLWRAMTNWPKPHAVLIAGWAAIVFAFHAGAPWQNFRFALAYLPPLALLTAAGLVWAWTASRTSLRILAAVCALSLIVTLGNGVRLLQGFIDRKDDELALVAFVRTSVEPSARLFTFGPTLALRQYSRFPMFDLFDLSPAELAEDLASPLPAYALVDEASIAQQWSAEAPGRNLAALRAARHLTSLGMHGTYTLYRLDAP